MTAELNKAPQAEAGDLIAECIAAMNRIYPIPVTPHLSVADLALQKREAFRHGWIERGIAADRAQQAGAAAPSEVLKDLWIHEDMARDAVEIAGGLSRKDRHAAHKQAVEDLLYWRRRALTAEASLPVVTPQGQGNTGMQGEPAGVAGIPTWQERITEKHPKSQAQYWPDDLKAKYMAYELADLRAQLVAARSELDDWLHSNRMDELQREVVSLRAQLARQGQDAAPAQADEPLCPACQGSGESMCMEGAGPDAYEVPFNCPYCGGSGGLLDAYNGLVALLNAEREKYLNLCGKVSFVAPEQAPAASQSNDPQVTVKQAGVAVPDDIRAAGWTVAVHNDYRLNGEAHTFWLFTKAGVAVKGEGRTDADALAQVRAEIALAASPPPAAPQQPESSEDELAAVLRDMLAIQDACGLHTDEYAPGSVIEYIKELEAEQATTQAVEQPVDDARDAARLADGYEGGFYSNAIDEDGIGKFTLYYKSAEQAEDAFTLVMRIIDAAMQSTKGSCLHEKAVIQHTGDGRPVEFCPDCGTNTPLKGATDGAVGDQP